MSCRAQSQTTPKRNRRYFTVEEANRALVYISRIVKDISGVYKEAVAIRQKVERPRVSDDLDQLRAQYQEKADQLKSLIDEIQQVGVELKDFEKGLVDFPALHEGREIRLCWSKEKNVDHITHWQEYDSGFQKQKPLSALGPKSTAMA